MLEDLPQSLINKVRAVLKENEEKSEATPSPEPPAEDGEKKDEKPKRKGEPIEFDPEIRPDVYTEPYKVQPTKV